MTPHLFFGRREGKINYLDCLAISSDLRRIRAYHAGAFSHPGNEDLQMKGFTLDGGIYGHEKIVGVEVEFTDVPSSLRVRISRQMSPYAYGGLLIERRIPRSLPIEADR